MNKISNANQIVFKSCISQLSLNSVNRIFYPRNQIWKTLGNGFHILHFSFPLHDWSQSSFLPISEAPDSGSPAATATACPVQLKRGRHSLQGRTLALPPSSRPESEMILFSDLHSGDQGMIEDSTHREGFLVSPHPFSSVTLPQSEELSIFTGAWNHFPYWFSLLPENRKPRYSSIPIYLTVT